MLFKNTTTTTVNPKLNSKLVDNFRNTLEAYRKRDFQASVLPSIFVIEPTAHCNIQCKICPNSQIEEKGYISFQNYKKIIKKIRDTAAVIQLYFRGEPLLHPELPKMIEYAKKETDARVIISTNALSLNSDLSRDLINSGLDEIIFSVDYVNADRYNFIKKGSNYNKVLCNISNFLKFKNRKDKPCVTIKLLKIGEDTQQIEKFKKFWTKKGCNIEICNSLSWANQLTCSYNTIWFKKKASADCAEPWFRCVVTYNGDVVLCCFDYNKKIVLGNIVNDPLEHLWNSELIKSVRQGNGKAKQLLCGNCSEKATLMDFVPLIVGKKVGGRP